MWKDPGVPSSASPTRENRRGEPAPLTVLLPVRDAASTLDRALRSLRGQTWADFLVIAVDDGSTDDSLDRLRAHAAEDPRIHVVPGAGHGLVHALETARARARSPYLARMDADDICHPDRFRRQLDFLRTHPRVGAVGGRVALFPRSALGPGWRRYQAWLNGLLTPEDHAREIFIESPLAHPSVLLRADAVAAVGGYRDGPWAEDYDLWHRLHAAGWELAKIDAPVLAWRQTATRLSLTSPRYSADAFLHVRAHYLARSPLLAGGRMALWGASRNARRLGRRLQQDGLRIETVYDVDPAKIGRTCLGAPVRSWLDLEPAGRRPLVVAVGAPGARGLIRPEARRQGYREGIDLVFAA